MAEGDCRASGSESCGCARKTGNFDRAARDATSSTAPSKRGLSPEGIEGSWSKIREAPSLTYSHVLVL